MSARQQVRGALLSLATLLGCVLVLEVAFRQQRPPRVQAVFPDQAELVDIGGEISWRSHSRGEREREACVEREGGAEAVILGSSILFGVQLDWPDTLGAHLEKALGGCVVNLAQPASSFQPQVATARHTLPVLDPDIVVWEIWQNSPNSFTLIGDIAYNFGHLEVDEGGVPSPFGVSVGLNRALFSRSALWRFVTLTQAAEQSVGANGAAMWKSFASDAITQMRAVSGDARIILPLMPPLSAPFADSAANPPPGYDAMLQVASARGVETIDVARSLIGHDHEALRLDPCCHLNAAGQAALAEVVMDAISPPEGLLP